MTLNNKYKFPLRQVTKTILTSTLETSLHVWWVHIITGFTFILLIGHNEFESLALGVMPRSAAGRLGGGVGKLGLL